VIESVGDADFVVLVTEPTPFGLNDLKLAVQMARTLDLPFGVVINRADIGDRETVAYCRGNDIRILAEIPDDLRIAEASSRGELFLSSLAEYEAVFPALLDRATQCLN
jgi:MinD superfamily P-loop ATPase